MEFIGDYAGYRVYRNSEGFLEGIKAVGRIRNMNGQKMKSDMKRIVTNQKTTDGFVKYVKGVKPIDKPVQIKVPFQNPNQLNLFDDNDGSETNQ